MSNYVFTFHHKFLPHRVARRVIAGLIATALVVGVVGVFSAQAAEAATLTKAQFVSQVKAAVALNEVVGANLMTAKEAVVSGQAAIAASDGLTLDQTARATLVGKLTALNAQIAITNSELDKSHALLINANVNGKRDGYEGVALRFNSVRYTNTKALTAATKAITPAIADVSTAVTAYKAKQAQIAAAAAAQAAAQAAARAAARHTSYAPAGAGAGAHVIYVWTASGFQASIDACRGAVDVTAQYGVHTIAAKWGCGGASVPRYAGALIRVTGIDAGLYRSSGIVVMLSAYTDSPGDIPGGYDLIYQSCLNDNAATEFFLGLTRIGN